jgi:hypothetical protein
MMRSQALSAHDSQSPRGLLGFRRGFRGRHHRGRNILMGLGVVNGFRRRAKGFNEVEAEALIAQ